MSKRYLKASLILVIVLLVLAPLSYGVTEKEEPTIMVIIPEIIIEHSTPDPAVETAIINKLVEKDFKVIDEKQIDKIRDKKETKCALEGNEECIMNLASKFKADIMVLGEAFAEDTGTTQGLQTVRARAEIRIVRSKNAVILGSKGVQVGASDLALRIAGKKGLQRAGKKVSQYVVNQLAEEVGRESIMTGGDKIVEVSPISFSELSDIKNTLRKVESVSNFEVKNFSAQSGQAKLDIDTSSSAYELAELLIKLPYGPFRLKLASMSDKGADTLIKLKKEVNR